MDLEPHCEVTCPYCYERFSIAGPSPEEAPVEWDYDCEICCQPILVSFSLQGDQMVAEAAAE